MNGCSSPARGQCGIRVGAAMLLSRRTSVPSSLERNEKSVVDAAYPGAAADGVVDPIGSLQLRHGLALCVSLANENDDIISLLSEDETECVGDASNEILEGLAVRSRLRHLNYSTNIGSRCPQTCHLQS